MPVISPSNTAFFATCPKGLEGLLFQELQELGAATCKETVAGVNFTGDLAIAYRACLWSRLANKILMPVLTADCRSVDDLYRAVASIDWDRHMAVSSTFAIDYSGQLQGVKHSHFGALKAKDAVADYFTRRYQKRPNVDPARPDLLINVRVAKGKVVVSVDLSGESLHKRGYRLQGGSAPLKENLAAAILLRADWPGVAARGGALIDPMCGSGTLLIEGAMMSANMAPGLMRKHWGFQGWKGHQPGIWQALLDEAKAARTAAMNRQWPEIRGYDASKAAIEFAQQNIDRLGLGQQIRVLRKELARFVKPTHAAIDFGLVVTNPPYGERLGESSSLVHLYRHLGQSLKKEFPGWKAAVFTGNPELGKTMGLRSYKQYPLFNGAIASKLLLFSVEEPYFVNSPAKPLSQSQAATVQTPEPLPQVPAKELSSGAQMFANRLKKNLKQLDKWASKNQVSCYRVYDADMPEYAVAVDRYRDWVHVAEYAAPGNVDAAAAGQRLADVFAVIPEVMNVPADKLVLKQRDRQRGNTQYQKVDKTNDLMEVIEGDVKLLVNLQDYLDTGLFLDHRKVRMHIASQAKGQRFLNLFCYTGAATVHAARGGATFTDSVDLSATYLEWARKNLSLNGFSDSQHRTIRADVMEWLKSATNTYDLIFLDPPTFSNSKKMSATLDIQRDQLGLIQQTMKLLSKSGVLIFSNNHRRFKLDESIGEDFQVEEKTAWSLDRDFQRGKPIHQCWFISHKS